MSIGQRVPEGLAAMPPGPGLACLLAGIDPTRVANDDIVDVLAARSRQLAHDQAHMFTTLSEVIHRTAFADPGEIRRSERPEQYGPDEVRAALAWTRRAADHETHLARTVVTALPQVHAALRSGDIDRPKAVVFARHLEGLAPAQAAAVCAAVLPHAPRLTTGQITDRIKRLIIEIDPAHYERRYRTAVRDRKVVAYLAEDGTAVLTANGLPAEEAAAAIARIDTLSRAARRSGHPGTLDQIRADLVLGLLDGSLHHLSRDEIIEALINRYTGRDTDTDPDGDDRSRGDGDGDGDGDTGGSGGRDDLEPTGTTAVVDNPAAGTDAAPTSTGSPAATATGTTGVDPSADTGTTTGSAPGIAVDTDGTAAVADTATVTDTASPPCTCSVGPDTILLPPIDPVPRNTDRRFDELTPDIDQVVGLADRDRGPPAPDTVP